ncbi:hypothetical protein OPV22_017497 [Ensete ventricosum]|uniref:Uncharacterized protein n=1 Tax=Ensete ventricosum TaxID=4639 RepID=A0AAV8QS84_ENSVE|nr:hypothetical protein OPV22_017497 [Ensete ventricosum]
MGRYRPRESAVVESFWSQNHHAFNLSRRARATALTKDRFPSTCQHARETLLPYNASPPSCYRLRKAIPATETRYKYLPIPSAFLLSSPHKQQVPLPHLFRGLKGGPQPKLPRRPPPAMEMRKVACAVLVAAASATGTLAAEAPAPGPASSSFAVTPAVGAVIGASVLSFFAFYLQ